MKWIYGLLGLYLLVHLLVYGLQKKIIFQPVQLAADYAFTFDEPFREHFIAVDAETRVHALQFAAKGASRGCVLYFHGNADNLQRWGRYAKPLTDIGYEVLMIDYPQYGKSRGPLNEEMYYAVADKTYAWAVANLPQRNMVLYGRSLGTAAATYLASQREADLLILETPFNNMSDAIRASAWYLFLPFPFAYRFPNDDFLAKVDCKTVIYHGTKDRIVPLKSAIQLKPLLKRQDEFVVIEGGGHRNLSEFETFLTHRRELLSNHFSE